MREEEALAPDEDDGRRGRGPSCDVVVAGGGYLWFYLDVSSDDARFGLTAILMVGSAFSPWYARARAGGAGAVDPLAFCACNVALYAPAGDAWALTEAPGASRARESLRVAGGRLAWTARGLSFTFSERTAPWGRPFAGEVEVTFDRTFGAKMAVDRAGRHTWWPIAPHARASVTVPTHGVRFAGAAYVDANQGDEALEIGIDRWSWSRTTSAARVVVTYDVEERERPPRTATFAFDREARPVEAPPLVRRDLPRTGWGLARPHRAAGDVHLVRTLEDTPFYARSAISERTPDGMATGMHETLDLRRFRNPLVRHLLGYRMRRPHG